MNLQDGGCRMQDVGCRMRDAGCRMRDAGCRMAGELGYRGLGLQLIFVSTNRKNPTTYHVSKDRTHALKYQDLRLAFLLLLLDIDQEHVLAVVAIIEHECGPVDIGFMYYFSM